MVFAAGDVITALELNRAVPLRAKLTANQSITSSTTLQSTTLTLNTEANRQYAIDAEIPFQGSTTGDCKFGLIVPTGATVVYTVNSLESGAASATGASFRGVFSAVTGAIAGAVGGSAPAGATIRGRLVVGANAGAFTIQFAQQTSDGTATTLLAGAWLTLLDVT